ncbi:serine hydrolase domain-containing protein [Arthrobacter cryoconiti]|uniref:Serine hydrolase domain-containing protein n=1 Tax=Arthrobacter cryoconiti TaxID=748907 RepID=A0ABV8R1W9_9MICC|nr:serine hydrolase domain-containing protein [Arthrobacter cryoconiti]MCC9069143.1 beta-lactamase family protein [Arthrobacter cryoconiti]
MNYDGSLRRVPWIIRAAGLVAAGGLLLSACSSPTAGSGTNNAGSTTTATTAVASRPAAPTGALPSALQVKLQAALESVMAQYHVPGAAVGVWVPGQGSWTTAAGVADVAGGIPVTTDMVWPIRSITKSYTVTLILQLADEGKLSLEDTLNKYVPGVTDGDRITLLELANMSSGNADYVNEAFLAKWQANPAKIFTLDELNSGALGQPAQFAPGTDYVYTNSNINLLGAVIEKVTGEPYDKVLAQRILDPLGQTGTSYMIDASKWSKPHPVGYVVEDGIAQAKTENSSILGPAGSMFSTLEDGRVWATTLGTGALLKPATQELRKIGHKIAKPPYDLYAVGMGTTDGWWGHNGEGVGFTAATFYHKETGASIVVYMNESDTPDKSHPADQAFRALAAVLSSGASK